MPIVKKQSLDKRRKLQKARRRFGKTDESLGINENLAVKENKNEVDKRRIVEKRKNTDYLAEEQDKKKIKIQDENVHSLMKQNNAQRKRKSRTNETCQSQERVSDKERKISLRKNENHNVTERNRNRERLRQNESYKSQEKIANKQRKVLLRQNETYKSQEKIVDKQRKVVLRRDEIYRSQETEANKDRIASLRQDETYISQEIQANKQRMASLRQDEVFRSKEREQERQRKVQLRKSSENSSQEKVSRALQESQLREDETNLSHGTERDEVNEQLKKVVESVQQQIDSNQPNSAMPLTEFEQLIKEGPTETCNCCLKLIFPRLTLTVLKDPIVKKFGLTYVEQVFYDPHNDTFCGTCAGVIRKGEIPTYCHQNYKIVFDIPPQLKGMTVLEERLVSPRIPFMQIRRLGYEKQCSIRGQVVNVPIEINTTVKELPRKVDDTHTIQLKLMRKMSYTYAYMTETIRPKKVLNALEYLVNQSLYKSEGITISEQFLSSQIDILINSQGDVDEQLKTPNNVIDFDSDDSFEANIMAFMDKVDSKMSDDEDVENQFEREDANAHLNPAGEQTLLDNTKIENIAFAPGEGQLPIHLLYDEHAEELSFPTLFCGNAKEFKKKMTYATIAKLQASHSDRRFARTDFVLYMFKKSQMISVIDKVSIAIRKKIAGKDKYTAGQVTNKDFIANLLQVDEGYRFLKNIRTSPAHWETEKRKLLAMVRQFNIPTLFITISAAETKWPELLVILCKVIDNKIISENEANSLSYNEKTRLLRSDPITCARYFDNRFHVLLNHMKSEESPFKDNPIIHYYYRVEFQHRGSPHVHGLFWLQNAPSYNASSIESKREVAAFIDKYITSDGDIEAVQDVINYQLHHHSKSCKKMVKDVAVCRYNIPFFPSDITLVLEQNNMKLTIEKQVRFKNLLTDITTFLNSNKEDVSFSDFLIKFNSNPEEYREFLRNVIKKPTIILKRKVKDCFVNAFNKEILSKQKANMDIQYVLDPFSCVNYIVNYINKPERGVSKLMRDAMYEIKKGNLTVKEQLKKLGHIFLNASEVSAQEAAYNILQMHLSEASDAFIIINTKPYCDRARMLKQNKELDAMESDDSDVFESGVIEHYIQRPDSLENICLAEFAAYYNFSKQTKKVKNQLTLKDGSGFLSKKQNPKIINFVRYGLLQDPVNFYREQLMLYKPWRNEAADLENVDQVRLYQTNVESIKENRSKFDKVNEELFDEALKLAEEQTNRLYPQSNDDDVDEEYIPYALNDPKFNPLDCLDGTKLKLEKPSKPTCFQTPLEIDEKIYLDLIANLNAKQYEFLNYVLDNVIKGKVINQVVCGGAGVGKSRLITAIQQSLLRYYNSLPGNDPNLLKVLLAAPTGKAAYGINGMTLHAAFGMPLSSYSSELLPLNQDTINTMHANLIDLKLIIIDEFSMVGSKMFHNIDQRLKQIFKNKENFGGISVILFGDIRQLSPVADKWIFCPYVGNSYNVICGSYLWEQFKYFELTEIMRQKNDKLFANALNNMAIGEMTPKDIELIRSREIIDDSIIVPTTAIHLFKTNKSVDILNEKRLSEYTTETSYSEALDLVKGSCAQKTKQVMLQQAKKLSKTDSFGLVVTLRLQIDAKYMVTINLNTQDGIVNGAACFLRHVEKDTSNIPSRIWVEFIDENSGKMTRQENFDIIRAMKFSEKWTPLERSAKAIKMRKEGNTFVERKQFAIVPAEAITIHKSQGATYNQVALHIEGNILRSFLYVACSRATSLNGLYIYGKFVSPKKPDKHDLADKELKALRETKSLKSKYSKQFAKGHGELVITYQNVEGFNCHKPLIINNPLFVNSDILLLVETWNYDKDNVAIDGFKNFGRISRTTNKLSNKGFGISCYCKNAISNDITVKSKFEESNKKYSIQFISFTFKDTLIGVFYIPPNYPQKLSATQNLLEKFINENSNVETVILGDFNQNLKSEKKNSTVTLLKDLDFKPVLKLTTPTTKSDTHIDWCFSNCDKCVANTYETVFSHHKAIAVSLYESKPDSSVWTPPISDVGVSIDTKIVVTKKLKNTKTIPLVINSFSSTICNENMMFKLKEDNKNEIKTSATYLGDQVINRFHEVLSKFSRQEHTINENEFYPQDVLNWQLIDLMNSVKEILPDSHHIQILYGGQTSSVGHWICTYYDSKDVHIYDSLNYGRITDDSIRKYLKKLYPFKSNYVFHDVQQQPNNTDCGLFAIANAVTIYFKEDPTKVRYNTSLMRNHLWKILSTNVLELFPANNYSLVDRTVSQDDFSPIEISENEKNELSLDTSDSNSIFELGDRYYRKEIKYENRVLLHDSDSNKNSKLGDGYTKEIESENRVFSQDIINRFNKIFCNFSKNENEINEREYHPQNVTFWQSPELSKVQAIPHDTHHIQILFGYKVDSHVLGHWICTHYNGEAVNIYDSLNSGFIDKDSSFQKYLDKLYPFNPHYYLHEVQRQSNNTDGGIFAIANAVALYFKLELREAVKYDTDKMRSHLLKIFSSEKLEPFPKMY